MKLYIPLIAALFLAGCGLTAEGDFVRGAFKDKGSKVAAEGLRNATWFVCKAASVGSVQAEFGQSAATAKIYRDFCFREGNGQIVGPE